MFAYAKFSKYFFSKRKQSNSKAILQFFCKYEPRNVYKLKKSRYCETKAHPKYWLTELIKIVLTIKTTLILSLQYQLKIKGLHLLRFQSFLHIGLDNHSFTQGLMKIPSCSWNCQGQLIIVLISSRSTCNFLNLKKTCSTPFNPTKSNSQGIATKSLFTVSNFKLTSLLKIPGSNFVKSPAETIFQPIVKLA